jgi:3-deoxy-D-manno-octulosonic acid kinase
VTPPHGFELVRDGATTMLLRTDRRSWLLPLLQARRDDWAGYETRPLAAGRGGARLVRAAGHDVVVRPYRRGGLMAWVLRDTYVGWHPRPFRELATLAALQRAGAPVVEVYGAAVHWLMPGCYRGWLVTRYLPGSQTLWEWICGTPPPQLRARVFAQVGRAVRHLHDSGGWHPDLNLNNILIGPFQEAADADVMFIDFDRAHGKGLGRPPAADLERLERSAHKLDPAGIRLTSADLDTLRAAYAAGGACT